MDVGPLAGSELEEGKGPVSTAQTQTRSQPPLPLPESFYDYIPRDPSTSTIAFPRPSIRTTRSEVLFALYTCVNGTLNSGRDRGGSPV
jgi:hypothetical protein